MSITVTLDHAQEKVEMAAIRPHFPQSTELRAGHIPETLFSMKTENTHCIYPLTDGDKAAGPTAMLPKLCRDCLTIKISKEITLAY